jgi:hypothetical protein
VRGQLVIVTDPAGARISVDGRFIGLAPLTIPDLIPGDHLVSAAFESGQHTDEIAHVVAGESHVVRLALGGTAGAPQAPPASSAPPPSPTQATPVQQPTTQGSATTGGSAWVGVPSPSPTTTPPASETPVTPAAPSVSAPEQPAATQPTVVAPTTTPSLFTPTPALVLHREAEPLEADAPPVANHMNLGLGVDLMLYGRVLRVDGNGAGGTSTRIRFDAMFTRVVGVQVLFYTAAPSAGAGLVLAVPSISIGSRFTISPRFALNFFAGPTLLAASTDLEARASLAIIRHLSVFAGFGGSLVFAAGSRGPISRYSDLAVGLYMGGYLTGGVQWVF